MSENDETTWTPLVSFSGLGFNADPEHAYVHGVEFGQIWQRMRDGREAEIYTTMRLENIEVIQRAAAAEGWDCEIVPTEYDGWQEVNLQKRRAAIANPRGLRVV